MEKTFIDEQLNQFDEFTDDLVAQDKFSGSILIAKNDKAIHKMTAQLANKENDIKNTLDTKFNLGSCNKMFTGVAIAQLAEKGELDFSGCSWQIPAGLSQQNCP